MDFPVGGRAVQRRRRHTAVQQILEPEPLTGQLRRHGVLAVPGLVVGERGPEPTEFAGLAHAGLVVDDVDALELDDHGVVRPLVFLVADADGERAALAALELRGVAVGNEVAGLVLRQEVKLREGLALFRDGNTEQTRTTFRIASVRVSGSSSSARPSSSHCR